MPATLDHPLSDELKNTLRAALRAHEDKLQDALAAARRRKDDEHYDILARDLTSTRTLINRFVNS